MTDHDTDLDTRIARLDKLLSERPDPERGLGLRLALGLAKEIRDGLPLGSETGEMVLEWKRTFGDAITEEAIAQARGMVRDPARMTAEIGRRLGEAPATLPGGDTLDESGNHA